MRVLPLPPAGNEYLQRLSTVIEKELDKRTPDNVVRRELYLAAPNGSVWQITVDDLGALATTKVAG